jgi:guanylate kinase
MGVLMPENTKGKLIVISGPSGCGKGTVIKKLRETVPFWLSVSNTTRGIRPGETEDVTYHYISNEEFEQKIKEGNMLEYASYEGRSGLTTYYGTPKEPVVEHLQAGENVVLEIEVQGARQIKALFPEAVTIFIKPPSMEELERRLTARKTEKPEDIAKRLATALKELPEAERFDHIVINDNLSDCVHEVIQILENTQEGETAGN